MHLSQHISSSNQQIVLLLLQILLLLHPFLRGVGMYVLGKIGTQLLGLVAPLPGFTNFVITAVAMSELNENKMIAIGAVYWFERSAFHPVGLEFEVGSYQRPPKNSTIPGARQ